MSHPEVTAMVVDDGNMTSFDEWDQRSNSVARGLIANGVQAGDRVGLMFEESSWIDYAVAYVATHKAGAVAVPVFAGENRDYANGVFDDCGAAVVVCDQHGEATVTRRIVTTAELASGRSRADVQVPIDVDSLAEIIYTSGTTGVPRGVACTHGNLLPKAVADGHRRWPQFSEVTVLHGFALGSAAGQRILLQGLALARTTVNAPALDPKRFALLISVHRPAAVLMVPATAAALLNSGVLEGRRFDSVKALWLTGSATAPTLLAQLDAIFTEATVMNCYGLTEVGVLISGAYDPSRPFSVGRPEENTGLRIIGDCGADVVPGQVGEVWLSHIGVPPRAYYGDPKTTAEVFHGVWVATGDLGLVDDMGRLQLCGRKKDVINRGGRKISALEIEAVLSEHPAVAEAAVYGIEDDALGEAVAAAVTLKSTVTLSELRHFVGVRLGDVRIPARLHVLNTLPRNRAGKLIKGELRRMSEAEAPPPYASPATATEARLAGQWGMILAIEPPGRNDSFFRLGGRSLSVVHLINVINHDFGVTLQASTVYENDTLAELAGVIDALRLTKDVSR